MISSASAEYILDYFPDALDGVDQAGVLTEGKRGVVDIAGGAGGGDLLADLARVLPQRPFAPRPALDKLVALSARHRARPDPLAGEIGNFRQHGVVAVAFNDGFLKLG